MRYSFLLLLAIACAPQTQQGSSIISDEALLDSVQRATFRYFWDIAEPNSGMARERYHMDGVYPQDDKNVVTSGGSGFGVMAILVGIERGYVSREDGVARLRRITDFLAKADRFHGVWPHWMHGETGKTKPFSRKDNGGDLVETSFMAQGLLAARQYLKDGNAVEQALAADMDKLWREIEWNWHQNGENVLFWHWSPEFGWEMNFRITGYNECLITYVLAACSPTYPTPTEVYHQGWAKGGDIVGSTEAYGFTLDLKHNGAPKYGGPLFWSHYSYLGLDPRKLQDRYTNYWTHNVNHVLIDRAYCIENPLQYPGYGPESWGLTSSYSPQGYSGHKPEQDLGVISPTAALSSFPYAPEYCMDALRHFYKELGNKIWGPYGFYDAFSVKDNWYPQKYLAIDQGPIIVMIENHRTGLLWDLFMSCPEVQEGLTKLGFRY